ncbi:DNA-binding transcriptional regulator YiaG [Rheinheimera pacifica]|uniref:helix-turn-helix domain-containing protein n=1 Tax=Rheinheimera pacifica TaxID=173990 RepID=UPI0021671A37|nr:helix-turn-helix transcriptional regulator [Rheinheimera pacifica]MCS4309674.1 DNA-binding transcriptional regulator YiaG [Rheinheimera pacifica]
MSDIKATYKITATAETVAAFRNRPSAKQFHDPEYKPPSPEEVKALRKLLGWPQSLLAKVAGVSYGPKGSTTVRKWETAISEKEHRKIPYIVFRVMLHHAGVVNINNDPFDAEGMQRAVTGGSRTAGTQT